MKTTKDMPVENDRNNDPHGGYYAQLVSSTITEYDVTFIFYRIVPQRVDASVVNFNQELIEVSRVTLPVKAAKELMDVLQRQFSGQMPQIKVSFVDGQGVPTENAPQKKKSTQP